MRTIKRTARLALGAAAGAALALSSTTPASASTWELKHSHQKICVQTNYSHSTYLIAAVVGSWSTTIHMGMKNLPAGSTNESAPIPPGSNYTDPEDGSTTINGWIGLTFPPLPVGTYESQLAASDGTRTESNPVTINVKAWC
ncbi:hypothetical protein E1292_16780 [Nonomuraea deserti]|uniref:Uncharacterized protein n=1 Tax=Nonomuraea deserti TaxID=1848322 RepID=A0A4R4VKJ7_9ACTN|nr:DUF5980 family protein [Nonomuraea deserti]TDD05531.1 hypothetical protein E1292_16780 [Nonomuraea deserti]